MLILMLYTSFSLLILGIVILIYIPWVPLLLFYFIYILVFADNYSLTHTLVLHLSYLFFCCCLLYKSKVLRAIPPCKNVHNCVKQEGGMSSSRCPFCQYTSMPYGRCITTSKIIFYPILIYLFISVCLSISTYLSYPYICLCLINYIAHKTFRIGLLKPN